MLGAIIMSIYAIFWFLVVLVLSVLLSQLRHRRKVAAQIKAGITEAKDILNSTSEGIITTNSSGEITSFNLMAESVFGYKAHTAIGKKFLFLLPEESHVAQQHIMAGLSPNTDSSDLELIARRADGTRFPLAMTIKSFPENGKTRFLGMCRDISARKLAEKNSRRSQHFMEFLLQTSSIVFYTCNVKCGTQISYVSPNAEKLLGYKPETITDATAFWSRHVHPDDQGFIQSSRTLHMSEEHEDLEYRLKFADGQYRWIADSRTMINDDNGEPRLLIGCWTDIHDKKQAEINLALKEERFQISLKCAHLVTWDWIINTGELAFFGSFHKKLGLDENQAITFDDLSVNAHPEDREILQSAFRYCLVKGDPLDIEYRVVWPDKSIHWIHLTGELINDEIGSPVRMVGNLFDITARQQLHVAPSLKLKQA